MEMKLVGYLRVSTIGQVEDGHGLEIQEERVRQWAKIHGHSILRFYADEGISGKIDTRAGLEEALSAVRFNSAEGIVVASLDRLARSLTVQEAALQQVWSAGGRVFSIDTGEVMADDPDDPVRTFVRQILGAVSQLEAGMISRRLRRGREHKASLGGYAHGSPPYGFRADGGVLVADTNEQSVTQFMKGLRQEGRSLREITSSLNDSDIRSKRGGIWHPQTVARVLAQSERSTSESDTTT
jgi:DNA invertase Pin-like site-specific DNA recombinase